MPALVPTAHVAEIVWLGTVANRERGLASAPVPALHLDFSGPNGEAHGGRTRPSCSRVASLHPRGTEIANTRQLSILCADELAVVAAAMGLEHLDPSWLGAGMVLRGLPDFSHLPPSSRIQGPDGATLVVDMQNRPCHLPGPVIDAAMPGHGRTFRTAAHRQRGITAWVERPGTLRIGDRLRLFVPDQRAWLPSRKDASF